VTAIVAAMARGGVENALTVGDRVRHHRPRRRLLELYERRLSRRFTGSADRRSAGHETHERRLR
jgi:hypothetical protein